MDSRFGFFTIFVILDVSFVSIGDTILAAYAAQPVTQRNVAQSPYRQQPPVYNHHVTYTPDFVFPTEKPTNAELLASGKLQVLPPYKMYTGDPISAQKCTHYARQVDYYTGIKCSAGTPFIKKNGTLDVYGIILGVETKLDEFRHMVALGKSNSDSTFTLMCGGTLISHIWVLTAAHCTHGPNGSPSHARLGFHKLTDQNTGVTLGIKRMIRHPDYKPPVMYADIALIELEDAVAFTASIRPACLYQPQHLIPDLLKKIFISGWGVTEFAGEHSDSLLKAEVDLIKNSECTKVYANAREVPYGITSSMFCAGDARGNWSRDTCQGDSGGPLQIPHGVYPCLYKVLGITSLGLGCAIINTPGVYTSVPFYITWIENIVWPSK